MPLLSKLRRTDDSKDRAESSSGNGLFGKIFQNKKLTKTLDEFSTSFSTFVEQLPNKETVETSLLSVSNVCDVLVTQLNSMHCQLDSVLTDIITTSANVLHGVKMGLIGGALSLLVAWFAYMGWIKTAISTAILGFLYTFFGVATKQVDCGLTEYIKSWNKEITPKAETQGFKDFFLNSAKSLDSENLLHITGVSFFSLLTTICIGASAKCKDIQDFAKHVFIYQKGASSMVTGVDLISRFWSYTVKKIKCIFLDKESDGMYTMDKTLQQVDVWVEACYGMITTGFGNDVSYEDMKKQKILLKKLYLEGLEYVKVAGFLEKEKSLVIKLYNDRLQQLYKSVSTEPLGGEMRHPPMVVLLYGASGVGKTTLFDAVKSLILRVESGSDEGPNLSPDNVYVRNTQQAHWDGYRQQAMVFYDDLACVRDDLCNPNLELLETIRIKSPNPFPLPMAHLNDKGKFFTSSMMFCTTNVEKFQDYIKSMTYSHAVTRRLAEMCVKTRILLPFRKYMGGNEVAALKEAGLMDQHTVDGERAKYVIDLKEAEKLYGNLCREEELLRTLTDEEWEKIPKKKHVLPDGEQMLLNYQIYRFVEYNCANGQNLEQRYGWTAFANEIVSRYREHKRVGQELIKQQRAYNDSTMEDMVRGRITYTPSMIPAAVQRAMESEELIDSLAGKKFDIAWAEGKAKTTAERRDEKDAKKVRFATEGKFDQWLNRDPESTDEDEASSSKSDPKNVQLILDNWKVVTDNDIESMPTELQQAALDFESRAVALQVKRSAAQRQKVDKILRQARRVWRKKRIHFKDTMDTLKQEWRQCPKIKLLLMVSGMVGFGLSIWGLIELYKKQKKGEKKEPEERSKEPGTCPNIVDRLGIDMNISINGKNLSEEDLTKLMMGRYFTQGKPHYDPDPTRYGRSTVSLPTAMANEMVNFQHELRKKGVEDVSEEDAVTTITCDKFMLPSIILFTEAAMDQLSQSAADHLLPANTFLLEIHGIKRGWMDIGNVTFIQDKKLIMPYHYIQKLEFYIASGVISNQSEVRFSRAPTHLEMTKTSVSNSMSSSVQCLMRYVRVVSQVRDEEPVICEKDLVVVQFPAGSITGKSVANIFSMFITRKEMRQFNGGSVNGFLTPQRAIKKNGKTVMMQGDTLICTNIRAVNTSKCELHQGPDIEGTTIMTSDSGLTEKKLVLVRDRYEYNTMSRAGDCGAVLWVDHSSLARRIVGMHVVVDREQNLAISVPVTQEDLKTAMGSALCESQDDMRLEPLTESDVFGVEPLVPKGNFYYVGKLPKDQMPFQPNKTALRPSVVQKKMMPINVALKSNKIPFQFVVRKVPALLHKRITWSGTPYAHLFFSKEGKLMRKMNDGDSPLLLSSLQFYEGKGLKIQDPWIQGLEKCSKEMRFIDPNLIDMAIKGVADVMLRENVESEWNLAMRAMKDVESEFWNQMDQDQTQMINAVQIVKQYHDGQNYIFPHAVEEICQKFSMRREMVDAIRGVEIKGPIEIGIFLTNWQDNLKIEQPSVSMVLTLEQAVQGIPGEEAICSINGNNSPGYPYILQKLKGKKPWVGEELKCDGPKFEELRRDVDELIEQCKVKIPNVFFIDTLKDELRPIEKVKEGKTRVFSAGPMHFSLAFRMYFLRFLSHLTRNKIKNEVAIGINVYSIDWQNLAEKLSCWEGPSCVAGDFSGFDGSLSNQILESLLEIPLRFYKQHGATDEEQIIRKSLWLAISRSQHIVRGVVYKWANSQPSGNPATAQINSMYNSAAIRMCYLMIFHRDHKVRYVDTIFPKGYPLGYLTAPLRTIADFEKDVKFVSYGDDNVMNINPDIRAFFNMNTIARAMGILNLIYTDENKSDNFIEMRPLQHVTFLKREFKKQKFLTRDWIAPLNIETVEEMLLWVRKIDDVNSDEHFKQVMDSTLREMVLHGKEKYANWCAVLKTLERLNVANIGMLEPFEDQMSKVLFSNE